MHSVHSFFDTNLSLFCFVFIFVSGVLKGKRNIKLSSNRAINSSTLGHSVLSINLPTMRFSYSRRDALKDNSFVVEISIPQNFNGNVKNVFKLKSQKNKNVQPQPEN